jgi:hypothetical protein
METSRRQARNQHSMANAEQSGTPAPLQSGGAAASPEAQQQPQQPERKASMRTCRRCKQQFDPAANGPHSCRYHSALWTGGEVSKVRAAIAACFAASMYH